MTQNEIYEMANQAGIESDWSFDFKLRLEAFAKLVAAKAIAELENQERNFCPRCGKRTKYIHTCTPPQRIEQEPVTWRNAAIRVGEDLCSVGPIGYYDMTANQWLDWALSVVTVHSAPQRTWVGLTDDQIDECDWGQSERDHARAIEAKLKERNDNSI